jgi:hypothetical protein
LGVGLRAEERDEKQLRKADAKVDVHDRYPFIE